ncbi:MAG TPA: translocation/assembly module TamB domain-containing protein, partial [Rhizomicrobium sp.]|nr:translocation/assembly module TamB domain-containing protein [Rhizomicrobium sp.]
ANTLSFTLTAGLLNASGQGTLQLATERADIAFSAIAPQMKLRDDLSWQSLSATGRFHGSFTQPEIEAYLIVSDGTFDTLKADQIALNIIGNAGRANLEAAVTGLMMPGTAADLFAREPVTVRAGADLKAVNRPVAFSISHPLLNLHGRATTRGATTVTAQLAIPALAPFAATQGIDMRGTAGLDITVNQADPRTQIRLQGRMDTQGDAIPVRLLGRDARLDFNVVLENSDVVESTVSLRGAAITADANGTLKKGVLGYGVTFNLSDLSRLSDMLQGSLAMRGDANGPLATAALRARGNAQIATKGFAQQQVAIEIESSGLPAPHVGRLDVRGRLNGAPLSIQANLNGKAVRQLALTARWKSLDASGDIALPENAPVTGKMRLAVRQLADLAVFTGAQITGAANAAIVLAANRGKTDAQLNAGLDGAQAGSIQVGNADLRGSIADLFGNRSFDMTLAARGVDASGFTGDASLELDGPQNRLAAKLSTNLKDGSGAPVRADATALMNVTESEVTLQSLSGAWRGVELALKAPATIDYAQGLAIDHLAARLGDGDITASGQLLPRLQLSASAQGITLASFKSFTPNGTAQGTLSGTAELSGTLAAPQGTITLKGSGLRAAFSGRAVLPATLEARAQLTGNSAAITANVQGGNATSLTVSGDIGLAADHALNLHAKGLADLALFDPLLAADGRRLRGKLSFETDIAGTMAQPRVTGSGQLSDGEFQDYLRGLQIQDITAAIQAQGSDIRITQFQGRAGKGTLSGSGTVNLSAPGLPVDFTLEAKNARPIVSDLFSATLSGTIKMTGTLTNQLNLSGDIRILGGEINLPDNFPPEVAVLNVRQRGRPAPPPPSTSRVNLDIAVRTTGPIFVRGHGIDAEMGGSIRVGGTSTAPTIAGGFQMNRG